MLKYQWKCEECFAICDWTMKDVAHNGTPTCINCSCDMVLVDKKQDENLEQALDRVLDLAVACLDIRTVSRQLYKFSNEETEKDRDAICLVQQLMQSITDK